MSRGFVRTALAVVVALGLLAACGNDDDAQSGDDGSSTTAADTASSVLSGEPVRFMAIVDATLPDGSSNGQAQVDAYKAAVAAINASGGVDGRPLEMDVCDAARNPNTTEACARKAVADKVPAVVSFALAGGNYVQILEDAGIADIGNALAIPAHFSSPVSFPIYGGGAGTTGGWAQMAVRLECTKAAYIIVQPPEAAAAVEATAGAFKQVVEASGIEAFTIQAPPGSPDFASFVANADDQNADCLVLLAQGADMVGLIRSIRQTGSTAKLITANLLLPQESIDSLGSMLSGVYANDAGWPPQSAEGHEAVEQFLADLEADGADISEATSNSSIGWASVYLLAHVAGEVETVDAPSILEALNALHDYDPGVVPPISFDEPAPEGSFGPRMFQPNVVIGSFDEDGAYVPEGWINIGTGEPVDF